MEYDKESDNLKKKRRVLLVDDEPAILKTVSKRLEVAGFEVLTSSDGKSALMKVRESMPDLIVLDVMLPGLGGYEVCKLLKENKQTAHIPIIMLSAKGQEEDYWKGMSAGADAYLTKPFEGQALQSLIGRLIEAISNKPNQSDEKNENK
jgi:DNA-binding response OmpR family regulator